MVKSKTTCKNFVFINFIPSKLFGTQHSDNIHVINVNNNNNLYSKKVCVKWGKLNSAYFVVSNGVRQGGILSQKTVFLVRR